MNHTKFKKNILCIFKNIFCVFCKIVARQRCRPPVGCGMPATDAVQQRVIPQRQQRHYVVEKLPLSRPPAQGLWGELCGALPNNKSREGGGTEVQVESVPSEKLCWTVKRALPCAVER